MLSRSGMSNSTQPQGFQPATFACPWHFPGKKYLSGLPLPPPGDLPHPGIKLVTPLSPALTGGFLITSATWEAQKSTTMIKKIYKVLVKIDPSPDKRLSVCLPLILMMNNS